MKPLVLDACAVLAFLWREPGGATVGAWLHEAARGERRLAVHRLTLGEVYYREWYAHGEKIADQKLHDLRALPWDLTGPLSFELLKISGQLKVEHGLAWADAIAGAWARLNDAVLVTTDRKGFEKAARAGILEVKFLR